MASEAITFEDDRIPGIPLPLAPLEDMLPLGHAEVDRHHTFHPKESPYLKGLGGQAIRSCRIQYYNRELHSKGYHTYFLGPRLPQTEAEQHRILVLVCAGYVPEYGIDVRSETPQRVPLNLEQRQRLWRYTIATDTANELYYGYEPIRQFFMQQIRESIDDANKRRSIGKFLVANNNKRRQELGEGILERTITALNTGVQAEYGLARELESLYRSAPDNPDKLVHIKLGTDDKRFAFIRELQTELRAA